MNAFLISTGVVAVGEIGDKPQAAIIMLAARFDNLVAVVVGTMAGMLLRAQVMQ